MRTTRMWAFWRQLQYGTSFGLLVLVLCFLVYYNYLYTPANCFDGIQNADERGVDCDGSCTRICAISVVPPQVNWARSFRVTDGQYNAVAYVENRNQVAATPEVPYTFSLYDDAGLIAERRGTTILPPGSVYPIFEGRIQTGDRVPTQTFLELGEAELWLPAQSGRDQFRVVDRELIGADASPRINATILNQALTPADEVEVVATIFDSRGNALTSSRTFVDSFAPRTEQEVVFTWPEPIAKTIRSCSVPTDVVLAIDLSGSMNNDQAEPPEPITSVLAAANDFVSRLREQDRGAVVTFATEAMIDLSLTGDLSEVSSVVSDLAIAPESETGYTNTADAFVRMQAVFNDAGQNPDARRVAVILTDGLATAPDEIEEIEDPEVTALTEAEALRALGVEVYAIGLGNEVNMDFVREIATDPDHAYQAVTRNQVSSIYQRITGAICEDGAAVIDIVPKSDASFESLQ